MCVCSVAKSHPTLCGPMVEWNPNIVLRFKLDTFTCQMLWATSESLEKEGNSDRCYNVEGSWGHYAKLNESVTKGQILYDSTYLGNRKQSDSYRQNTGRQGWQGGCGELAFMGTESQFCRWRKSCEDRRHGWLHNGVNVLNATELDT